MIVDIVNIIIPVIIIIAVVDIITVIMIVVFAVITVLAVVAFVIIIVTIIAVVIFIIIHSTGAFQSSTSIFLVISQQQTTNSATLQAIAKLTSRSYILVKLNCTLTHCLGGSP